MGDPQVTAHVSTPSGILMRLYLPARTPASGRTLVRAGRPTKTMPGFGGLAGVCRCGAARPADSHALPWRDCPACVPQRAHATR
ncbi:MULTISPECIES: hypothetical protein [unclassified Pseudonocardia]|uniref:hypothetical protein n=1 Tax=unclassified Pseudonocardia TaxID=2619320 RepID=UPI0001FFEFBE|nr:MULTISPECIES: hypothetical protein [unclassified Pseudonocardia]ALE74604.1 hypothetical protein FRP1_19445 [Pseudonocardia sp. EC080625-04]ALL78029.1 hypothetical protein AD006_26865 [Pseudonocardia sp. EC080610-09]ALL80941.1 hypothetical protein AD017_06460 [Pseudonocardia sp. EC080619-01]